MSTINTGQLELLRAVFCDEFASDLPGGDGLDHDAIADIVEGGLGVWIADLERTGLFARGEVESIAHEWVDAPTELVALLMGGLDEVTAKREAQQALPLPAYSLDRSVG